MPRQSVVCRYDFQFHGHFKNERFLKFKIFLRQIFFLFYYQINLKCKISKSFDWFWQNWCTEIFFNLIWKRSFETKVETSFWSQDNNLWQMNPWLIHLISEIHISTVESVHPCEMIVKHTLISVRFLKRTAVCVHRGVLK